MGSREWGRGNRGRGNRGRGSRKGAKAQREEKKVHSHGGRQIAGQARNDTGTEGKRKRRRPVGKRLTQRRKDAKGKRRGRSLSGA
jgi:hypothetical protein